MLLGPDHGPEILIPEKRNALLKCPRCDSANTKFCYYNNYSRSQPRHFCRSCHRYWTEGGALRDVPVGGTRRNKRRKIAPVVKACGGNPAAAISHAAPGELEGAIFPDIGCHQVFCSLPEPADSPSFYGIEGFFDSPLPHNPLMFFKDFGGASLGPGGMGSASSSSCSSSPSHYSCRGYCGIPGGGEEGLLGMMDVPSGSPLVEEETVLPASCWDFWHDFAGFTDGR